MRTILRLRALVGNWEGICVLSNLNFGCLLNVNMEGKRQSGDRFDSFCCVFCQTWSSPFNLGAHFEIVYCFRFVVCVSRGWGLNNLTAKRTYLSFNRRHFPSSSKLGFCWIIHYVLTFPLKTTGWKLFRDYRFPTESVFLNWNLSKLTTE